MEPMWRLKAGGGRSKRLVYKYQRRLALGSEETAAVLEQSNTSMPHQSSAFKVAEIDSNFPLGPAQDWSHNLCC